MAVCHVWDIAFLLDENFCFQEQRRSRGISGKGGAWWEWRSKEVVVEEEEQGAQASRWHLFCPERLQTL